MTKNPQKKYIPNDLRFEILEVLVEAAVDTAERCIDLSQKEDYNELIRLTDRSDHVRHHQRYPLDARIEGITNDVLRPKLENLEKEHGLSLARRMEHSGDDVQLSRSGSNYSGLLLTNPIEGGDGFAYSMRHIGEQRKGRAVQRSLNPQACITMAVVEKEDPFNPVATVAYHFLNSQVYSSVTVIGPNNEHKPIAFLDKGCSKVKPVKENDPDSILRRDLAFFLADYKFINRRVIGLLQESLIEYGYSQGARNVDTPAGQCASVSNILQVVDGCSYHAYIDARSEFSIEQDHPLIQQGRRYAKLLYTNVIAVLPIVKGFGFKVTDIHGQELEAPHNTDLLNKSTNPEITLVIAKPHFFNPDSKFYLIGALEKGITEASQEWVKYKDSCKK